MDLGLKNPMILLLDKLPEHIIWEIMNKLQTRDDRNSASLTCKFLYQIDNQQRKSIRFVCGLNPANEGLILLCNRFQNLHKVEISYNGWSPALGNQLDDHGVLLLSNNCPNLQELSLSYCSSITDQCLVPTGSLKNLSSLKLSFLSGITATGLLRLLAGNQSLKLFHLIECQNVTNLEFLGNLELLENLCIRDCNAINEAHLFTIGQTWRRLRCLWFEFVRNNRNTNSVDTIADRVWQEQLISFDSLEELYLKKCVFNTGRGGMVCLLEKCRKLKIVILAMCFGVSDFNLHQLSLQSRDLRVFMIKARPDYIIPYSSLKDIAKNCSKLEWVTLSSDPKMPCLTAFGLDGIMSLIQKCPIHRLYLDLTYLFNDVGMEALSSAQYLETLIISRCDQITDEGMKVLSRLPRLRYLTIVQCTGITDNGFKSLVGSYRLKELTVNDCPKISSEGVCGREIAYAVKYTQNLAWMH